MKEKLGEYVKRELSPRLAIKMLFALSVIALAFSIPKGVIDWTTPNVSRDEIELDKNISGPGIVGLFTSIILLEVTKKN